MWSCRKKAVWLNLKVKKVNGGQINSLGDRKQHIQLDGIQADFNILTTDGEK